MKKIVSICIIMSLVLCLSAYVSADEITEATEQVQVVQDASVLRGCHSIDAQSSLLGTGQLTDNVQAVFLYEANSDTLMYAWNPDAQMYPASLVKIMTAWIALEEGNLADKVAVTQAAVDSVPYDAASAELVPGEVLTLEELLYCLLVDSANDAAAVIAEHISGSQAAFVEKMNAYALQIGCNGTNYMNVHGLHHDTQYTTARDSARILKAAMDNEKFREIFSAVTYTVMPTNKSEARELTSGNFMTDVGSYLYYDQRVIGGRTGVASDGRRCFAAVSEYNGMQLISVVMGCESVYKEDGYTAVTIGGFKETKKLLDAGFTGYKPSQVLYANQALIQCKVTDGDADVVLGPQTSLSTVLPEDITFADLDFRYTEHSFTAPVETGQKVSSVQIWYGSMCVAEADLFALNAVRQNNVKPSEAEQEREDSAAPTVIIVISVIVGTAVLTLLFVRFSGRIKIMLASRRSKQYRRSRRRSQ